MKKHTLSEERLFVLTRELLRNVKGGVIVLQGDLAAGKTTLVRAVVKAMGVADIVTS
ncbi:tRNA (adenosine(37)-N6)-threonylcarbamoyltransferase complex ATPase subunit type 1 TsaE, partial [Sulfurimonas sp. SAG-AH-194-C20]